LVDGLAQRATVKGASSKPVKLRGSLFAVLAAGWIGTSNAGAAQWHATPGTDRGMDALDSGQAVCAQPGTQVMTGHTVWWKEEVDDRDLEIVEPHQAG
jgi:hypothetical protein